MKNIQEQINKHIADALIHISKNDISSAKNILFEIEKLGLISAELKSIRAVILVMEDQLDPAEEIFLELLANETTDFDVLFNLAYIYQRRGHKETAIALYKTCEHSAAEEGQLADLKIALDGLNTSGDLITKNSSDEDDKGGDIFKLIGKDKSAYVRKERKAAIEGDPYEIFSPEFFKLKAAYDYENHLSGDGKADFKVLHGTMEIANQMNAHATSLNRLGIFAKRLTYYPNYLRYYADYVLDISRFRTQEEAILHTRKLAADIIPQFDIFHFYFGTSLCLDMSDIQYMKDSGKKMFMNYLGSECRLYDKAIKLNPYIKVKFKDEEAKKRTLEFTSQFIKYCIVGDRELYEYAKDYFDNIFIIGPTIDVAQYEYIGCRTDVGVPVIIHAPTSPEIKGSHCILKVMEELKAEYDFDFILVQNMSHEEAKKMYQKADIIIDSVLEGAYGVFACEAMAMGKPVVGWITDFMMESYPRGMPIYSANPDNLKARLIDLIKDSHLRKSLGEQGRRYVVENHDLCVTGQKLLDIYKTVL